MGAAAALHAGGVVLLRGEVAVVARKGKATALETEPAQRLRTRMDDGIRAPSAVRSAGQAHTAGQAGRQNEGCLLCVMSP